MGSVEEVVTTPSGLVIAYNDGNHRYRIKVKGESFRYVPSVTTILDKAVAKNLAGWAERGAVEALLEIMVDEGTEAYPVESWTVEEALTLMQDKGVRHWQRRDAAGLRGTSVHKAFERLAEGKVPKLSGFPVHERGYIQAICLWWSDVEPEVEFSEIMVGSAEHSYAGRMDFVGKAYGGRRVIDLKTSKAVYDSHHYQLAGYTHGLKESGYGEVDGAGILRVAPDGTFEYLETWATEEQWLALVKSCHQQRAFEKATPKEVKDARDARKNAA